MPIINFGVWNMEWMNDLFTNGPAFKGDDETVRGPNPGSRNNPCKSACKNDPLTGVIGVQF